METKICKKCNTIKEQYKSGIFVCKNCKKINSKKYYNYNKNNISFNRKLKKEIIFYDYSIFKTCKICNINKSILFFTKKYDNKYGVRNICKECEVKIRQNINNNPELLQRRREYNYKARQKNKNNPLNIIKRSVRKRIADWCKIKTISKSKTTKDILGISYEEFKIYIENKFDNKMSWNNYGKYWHIDHIIPLSSAKTKEEMYKLNHYTNLQPLDALTNLKKGAKF